MLEPAVAFALLLCLPAVQTYGADERDLALEIRHEVLAQLGSHRMFNRLLAAGDLLEPHELRIACPATTAPRDDQFVQSVSVEDHGAAAV
jgi:hypothetical protein